MFKSSYALNLFMIAVMLLFSSCSFLDRYDPGFLERQQNTQNVKKLKIGMTKKEVLQIMGLPLIHEEYNKPDIWFYYTDWDWADCARTESECTPLVFKNGVLVGMDRAYYKNYQQSAWQYNYDSSQQFDIGGEKF